MPIDQPHRCWAGCATSTACGAVSAGGAALVPLVGVEVKLALTESPNA